MPPLSPMPRPGEEEEEEEEEAEEAAEEETIHRRKTAFHLEIIRGEMRWPYQLGRSMFANTRLSLKSNFRLKATFA